MTVIPFLTYKILPSQNIIRENIRPDHVCFTFYIVYLSLVCPQVKEDIDALIHALTPILYITKNSVPKPPFLDPSVIHHWIDKVCLFFLLRYNYDNLILIARYVKSLTTFWLAPKQSR